MSKKLLIVSTSTVHGSPYLAYMKQCIQSFFSDANQILFIPYARPGGISHDGYTAKAASFFEQLGKSVRGIHTFSNPAEALDWADGVFTGGGNTFVLLNQLYEQGVFEPLQKAVNNGLPYMGTSAGSNITGLTVCTTNDMPIVYPPTFNALAFVPFNLNPHYLDPDPTSTHMGETRETRIGEFHHYNSQPVIGLREGSALLYSNGKLSLLGEHTARIFERDTPPYELGDDADFNFLMKNNV